MTIEVKEIRKYGSEKDRGAGKHIKTFYCEVNGENSIVTVLHFRPGNEDVGGVPANGRSGFVQ